MRMGNRFDALRLVAALGVFVSHGVFLYALWMPVPFPGHSLGSLSVYVFFFISGYLVCQSWMREPGWRAFWVKRLARVFPGLVVSVALTVFVLGWAVTALPSAAYWSARGTWLNLANNAAGLATVQTLPGVFESNPFARAVNGSLWTIRYELTMYGVLASLAWAARGCRWVHPVAACTLAVLWSVARTQGWDAGLEAGGGWFASVFRWRDFCGFGVPFFAGCTFAVYEVRARSWMLVVALVGALVAFQAGSDVLRQVAVWVLVACGIFFVAFAGRMGLHAAGRGRVDLSYGVYIYAFPIQQAMTELCLRQGWPLAVCMSLALALTLALAWLSWHCVERPCIWEARRWSQGVR